MICKHITILIFLLTAVCGLFAQQEAMVFPANTPLYRTPDPQQNPVIILFEEKELQTGECKNVRYDTGPLLLPLKFYETALPGVGIFWAAPGLEYSKATGSETATLHPRQNIPLRDRGIVLLFLALICAVMYFSGRLQKIRNILPYAGIFLFCAGLFCFSLGRSGNVIQGQADDFSYFEIACDVLHGDFSGPWRYTVGFPLFYIPFILLQNAYEFDNFYMLFLCFNALTVTPLFLCFAFSFFKKYISHGKAFCVILLWSLLAIFWQFRYFAAGDPQDYNSYIFTAYAAPPVFSLDFTLYSLYTWFGVNCVSDTVAAMLLFAALFLFVSMKPNRRNLLLFSALFGLICLVRLNNIFYAPAFFFLYLQKYKDALPFTNEFFRMVLPPAALFLAIVSIQAVTNFHHFGSPFTTPYILHDTNIVKWNSQFLIANISLLFISNKAWFLPALLAVFFQKDRRMKYFFILWCAPVILFFMGYGCTFNSPIRFLLPVFPVMALMIVTAPFWQQWKNGRNLRLVLLLIACAALTCPWMPEPLKDMCGQWNLTGRVTEILTMVGSILAGLTALSFVVEYVIYRKKNEMEEAREMQPLLLYGALFLLLWYEPTAYGVFALFAGVILYYGWKMVQDVRENWKTAGD